jgi:biotin transporter BioY
VAFFLVSTLASDVIARTTIGSEAFGYAISQHAYYAATQPIGTGVLLAPFLLVAWMASSVARRTTQRRGIVFLCITCSVLALMYFLAYQDSQQYMAHRMWTAATLAIGFLAFNSIPVLILALVTFLIVRQGSRVEP